MLCGLIPLRPADRRLWSLLPVEEETHPVSWVTALTPDQPNFVYTATFLCLGNAKFFFSFKIFFFDYMVPLALAADSRI